MKKYFLYGLGALMGLALTACDDYKEPNPPAQHNPQESVLQTSDVEVSSLIASSYNLEELNNAGEVIEVANIYCETLPAGYNFGAEATISIDDFATSTPVVASVVAADEANNWKVVINPDDMDGAFREGISRGPKAQDLKVRFLLTTVLGSQVAYIGGLSNYYGPYATNVTPLPAAMVIEEAYYLIGTIDGWEVAGAVKFNHSDKNQYDDPIFTVSFEVPETAATDGWWWKIIPQSTYETGEWSEADYSQFGVATDGDTAASGMLVPRLNGKDPGAGNFTEAGQWMLTIDMENLTYEFTSAVEVLYTPGAANEWSAEASMQLSTSDFATYTGYALLSTGGFKFTTAPDWDHTNYGMGDGEGILTTDPGAGNLTVAEDGLYWCNVNITELSYSATQITTIGVIGDATANGWDASTAMSTSDNVTWTLDTHLNAGEFKFRANDDWAVNLGGNSFEDLTQDGPNLKIAEEGDYSITLNLGQLPYSCTVVKK